MPAPARKPRLTLAGLARELGVSTMTVSYAFNRPERVAPATRERVLAEARRLGYAGPHPIAASLRRGRAGAVGVLYPNPLPYAFDDPAAVAFLGGLSTVLVEEGLGLLLIGGSVDPAEQRRTALDGALVDGIVVYSLAEDDPLLTAVRERRLPLVIVDQPRLPDVATVGIDDEAAAYGAARHLLNLGHRRLGVVSFGLTRVPAGGLVDVPRQRAAGFPVTAARLRGYERAVAEAGLSWADVPVYEGRDSTPTEGAAAAETLLAVRPRPTALLALSDRLAAGVLAVAARLGLAVPGDLSVVGFDDAVVTSPALTTVAQPHREKGAAAARLLTAALRGPTGEEVASPAPLPAQLVVRRSTGPA